MISLAEPEKRRQLQAEEVGGQVHVLGVGAVKKVYRGFDQEEGRDVAWNQVKLRSFGGDPSVLERLFSEIKLLQTLENENIIVLYSFWRDTKNSTLNFITEACASSNLRDYMKKRRRVSLKALKNWSRQILRVKYKMRTLSQNTTVSRNSKPHQKQRSNTYWSMGSLSDRSMADLIKIPEHNNNNQIQNNEDHRLCAEASRNAIEVLKSNVSRLGRQVEMSYLELESLRKQILKENKRGQDMLKKVTELQEKKEALEEERKKDIATMKEFYGELDICMSRKKQTSVTSLLYVMKKKTKGINKVKDGRVWEVEKGLFDKDSPEQNSWQEFPEENPTKNSKSIRIRL
ncbi:uncharacterized protein LOC128132920 [Lactuca sativa]|uniref:uncharacterized protein LOC128132920 n=1 Tax=Lactuca sativa TaxID=4236 RepID=UPI0022AF05AB|nr:uncharacterized protein LOC128132920 [Lactuca sativa]